jgi:hypothetical protein
MWISPNYQDTNFQWPLSIDDKITIFLDRTYGWQLNIADQCINGKKGRNGKIISKPIPHSDFAALHIVLSYFEMIAKYQGGFTEEGKSKYYFKEGVYAVFPQLKTEDSEIVNSLLDALYSGARCGLYHAGMTDRRIVIFRGIDKPFAFDTKESRLIINTNLLIEALKAHLKRYEKQLRDNNNSRLRENFEKRFDFDTS